MSWFRNWSWPKRIGAGTLALFVIGGISSVLTDDDDDPPTPEYQTTDEACAGMFDTMRTLIEEPEPDSVASREIEAVARGASKIDVALAGALQSVAKADDAADVSANMQVAFRRCQALGWQPTPEELNELQELIRQPLPG